MEESKSNVSSSNKRVEHLPEKKMMNSKVLRKLISNLKELQGTDIKLLEVRSMEHWKQ